MHRKIKYIYIHRKIKYIHTQKKKIYTHKKIKIYKYTTLKKKKAIGGLKGR